MASRPTPHSVSVAALVALHCQEDSPLYEGLADPAAARRDADPFVRSLVLQQQVGPERTGDSLSTSSSLLSLPTTNSRTLSLFDPTVTHLLAEVKEALGKDAANALLAWLRVASGSIDAMVDLVDATCRLALLPSAPATASTAATPPASSSGTIDRNSQCGMYLWSIGLGFDELDFEDVALLWSEFHDQVEGACRELRVVERGTSFRGRRTEDPESDDDRTQALPQQWFRSPEQLADAMQAVLERGSGVFASVEIREDVEEVLRNHPELPVGHFANFLASVEEGDIEAATSSLHQYLDRSILAAASDGTAGVLEYAAVVVAFLHMSFGNWKMATAATEEAVRVAQQQSPTLTSSSVAYGLGWLSLISGASDGAGTPGSLQRARDLVQRCADRASESHLPTLSVGAHLLHAQMLVQSQHHHPARAWEPLVEALSHGAATPDDGSAAVGSDRPTRTDRAVRGDATLRLLGRQRLVAAGVWHALGQELLSELSSRAVLQQALGGTDQIPATDVASAIQNLVRASTVGPMDGVELVELQVPIDEQLATSQRLDSNLCVYAVAMQKLAGARALFNLPVQGAFFHEMGILQHEWAVRRGEFRLAEAISSSLASHLSPRVPNSFTMLADVDEQVGFRLSRQGRFEEAVALMARLVYQSRKRGNDAPRHGRLLLQQCRIVLESNPHGFTQALEPLLECLTVTDAHGMNAMHAVALSLLAQVHLRMKNPVRAVAVLESAMPTILQNEHVSVQGDAYLTLAKSHLCLAKGVRPRQTALGQNSRRSRRLRMTLRALDRSEAYFRLCEDCPRLQEAFYLQARVHDALGDIVKRDVAATNFVSVSRHLKQADVKLMGTNDALHVEALNGLMAKSDFSQSVKQWAQELQV